MARKNYEINMLQGSLYKNLMLYALPLMASGILQLLYNAADVIVVGRWAGSESLAAVGSCGSLMNLVINLFMGLSVGTSVVVAQRVGAQQYKEVGRAVQTTITISALGGVAIGALGIVFARTALELMDSPEDVIDLATLYIKICFAGVPALMIYNFGAAVLRAVGDTKRPLYFLALSGAVNVVLNLVFVINFNMGVAGVAIATIISQYISAVLVVLCLMRSTECYRFDIRHPAIHGKELLEMTRIGLPAGIQGTLFSFSNVIIQSTVNSFGSVIMAGNSAASNLENFIYSSMNALYHASLTFSGQNYGARQYKRTGKVVESCLVLVTGVGLTLGALVYFLRIPLLGIYSPDPAVVAAGAIRCSMICLTYFTCGTMEIMVGGMRGLGYSITPMIVSLLGACGMRIAWIWFIFPLDPTLECLYISYPISWVITTLVHAGCYLWVRRKLPADGESPLVKKRRRTPAEV